MNTFKKIISSVLMVVLLSGVFGTISVSASVYIPYDLYLDKNGVVYFKDGDISTKVADQVAKLDGKYIVTKKGKLFYCHQQQDWSWTLEYVMDDVESVVGDSCFTIIIKKDHSLWGWGKYCDHWEGTTAYPDYMDLTLIASDVKYGGTNLYRGTNIVYYIDSNNTLWSHYANDLSASPKKCMKNVKSMDYDKQLVTTLNGKLYFCSSNYQSRHRVEKVLICR